MQIGGLAGTGIAENGSGTAETATLTLNVAPATSQTFSGVLRGVGAGLMAVTKTGGGTQVLSGPNTYRGATIIDAGVLQIANNAALGTTAGGTTVTGTGQLQLTGGITTADAMAVEGRTTPGAQINNLSGGNTVSGVLTLTGSNATRNYNFNSDAGSLALTGGIASSPATGTSNLNLSGAGDGQLGGNLSLNAGANNVLTKSGTGTWSLSSGLSGVDAVSVVAGTLALTGSGDVDSASSIDVALNAIYDVSALGGGDSLLGTQTLTGEGTINGDLTAVGGSSIGAGS
jgi:autotransporter-associated beta strand protein